MKDALHSAYNFRSIDSSGICRHSHAALAMSVPEWKMNEDQVVVTDTTCDVPRERDATSVDVRTKAVVAALRAALDKVYNEDGDQQVRRLANDYRDWGGESDLPGPLLPHKPK
jgi:hypothetical protein